MITEKQIISFCKNLLEVERFSDYCKNGIQISGNTDSVQKIALGVTASKNFLEKAAAWGADLCICHHGIMFGKTQEINDILRGRIEICIKNNMGVAGFHLPLDAHPEVGNNAIICKKLEIGHDNNPHRALEKVNVGFTGNLKNPENFRSFQDFLENVETVMGQKANFSGNFHEQKTGEKVSRVCVISGGSSKFSGEVFDSGADTFIFGELSESSFHELKERNLNFVAAGHYATETFGVQALGEKILEEFGNSIETKFISEDCTV